MSSLETVRELVEALRGAEDKDSSRRQHLVKGVDDLAAMSPTQHSASAHDTTLVNAIDTGRRLGMKLPDEVVVIAIEVENVIEFGEEPTKAVADAIPIVTEQVLELLRQPSGASQAD